MVFNNTYKFKNRPDEVKEVWKLIDWYFVFTAKRNKDRLKVDNITKDLDAQGDMEFYALLEHHPFTR